MSKSVIFMYNERYVLCDVKEVGENPQLELFKPSGKLQSGSATLPLVRYSAAWWRQYRLDNAERLRAYKRAYDAKRYKTHPESEHARRKRWHLAHPEKYQAQIALNLAVRSGKLQKQPCSVCGSLKVNAHHDDYSKPLDVVWLCPVHHSERHHVSIIKEVVKAAALVATSLFLIGGLQ